MSDWSEYVKQYEDSNYEDLVEGFLDKYGKEWYEFVSEKFFSGGGIVQLHNEDSGDR